MKSTSTTVYTINFGKYESGRLEMLRNQEWQSCAVPLIWTEFTADIIEHRVREVTSGERFFCDSLHSKPLGKIDGT